MVRDKSKRETGEKKGVKQPAKEIAQHRVRGQQRTSLDISATELPDRTRRATGCRERGARSRQLSDFLLG